ncbi:MAG: IgGFc-binding protein [Alphaproteobacteria bacterium]|nr:IgGFc-binding protein [Alphaproteobacteria bacterium]
MRHIVLTAAALVTGCAPEFGIAPKDDTVPVQDTDVTVDSDTDVVDTEIVDTDTVDTDVVDSDTDVVDTDTHEVLPDADASTVGTRFWLAFMDNIELAYNGPPKMSVIVATDVATTGAIEVPRTGLSLPFTLAAGEVREIGLPAASWYAIGSGVTSDLGVRIVADDPVSVWAVHYRQYFSEASLLLPEPELDATYTVLAHPDGDASHPSEFVVLATRDATEVEIVPSVLTADLHPAGLAYRVTLQAGQTYQVQGFEDLSGTHVQAVGGEPLAVFGGAQRAEVGGPTCRPDSTLWDQVPGHKRLGTAYVVVPFTGQGGDTTKIVATQDNTEVRRDCGTPILLDAGEVSTFSARVPERITSDKPILVAQLNDSQSCNASNLGDPSLQILQPVALVRDHVRFASIDDTTYFHVATRPQRVNVTAPSTLTTLTLDGVEQAASLTPLASAPAWKTGSLVLAPGSHELAADVGVSAHSYGFSDYDATTTHLGYDCVGCATLLAAPTTCP